ncbi:MAG: hypothetical protein ACMXYK_05535 [Candidatus Woesearchaeota archaeon]
MVLEDNDLYNLEQKLYDFEGRVVQHIRNDTQFVLGIPRIDFTESTGPTSGVYFPASATSGEGIPETGTISLADLLANYRMLPGESHRSTNWYESMANDGRRRQIKVYSQRIKQMALDFSTQGS